jgi:hypothetical protein
MSIAGSSSGAAWKMSRSSWTWTSSAQSVGGPRAGDTGGGSSGSPRCVRIFRIGPGSVMKAEPSPFFCTSAHERVGEQSAWCVGGRGVEEASEPEPADHAAADSLAERGQIGQGDWPGRQERWRSVTPCLVSSRLEDAVGHAGVQVHVMVERRTEAVQKGDGAESRVGGCGRVGVTRTASRNAQQPFEGGLNKVVLACRETGESLAASFLVQGTAAEEIGRPARPEVLEELTLATGGRVMPPFAVGELVAALERLLNPPADVRRVRLWSHPLAAALVVGLLGIFWVGRKWQELL